MYATVHVASATNPISLRIFFKISPEFSLLAHTSMDVDKDETNF